MTAAPVSRNQTILVVDDEEIVRSLTTRMLEAHGYTVVEAGNGFDAWTLLESEGEHIDLVISDVVMPRLDGLALAVITVTAALPMGANVFLFAQRYQVAEGEITAAVALSTVAGVVTLAIALLLFT